MRRAPLAAVASLSFLAGLLAATVYSSRDLHQMHMEVESLRQAIDQLETENQFLLAQDADPGKRALRRIVVECPPNTPPEIQTAVRRQAVSSLSFLLGKPMQLLYDHPSMPSAVLNVQSIPVGARRYRLHVTAAIMTGDTLHLFVRADPQSDP
ncbi:hypothetical protein [Alicyclobacillus vulcanalis]|uniref:Uncharacterized protein n=1 Tax=Alicyclobacillus vulcanalis TaxID=252246 RepID=A0A1N7LYD9_9BACL|nr:hypothetical protein [Alicyclobacillus vulcanalis]SIS78824.1 hypothetical protein SAMN05421799_10474 [Alicyclobacillus vulcanalis]